jgi:hypothetical protein
MDHWLKAWYPYIDQIHWDDLELHVMPYCIILEGTQNIIQLLTTMSDLNKEFCFHN